VGKSLDGLRKLGGEFSFWASEIHTSGIKLDAVIVCVIINSSEFIPINHLIKSSYKVSIIKVISTLRFP
jgi:hypothetical protein